MTIRDFFRPLPFGAFVVLPAALAIVLLQPGIAESQSRGGGFDPNRIFDFMAGGKDYLDMNDIQRMASRDPSAPERWQRYMQEQGITNGRVTRDQFAGYMQARQAERGESPRGPGGPGESRGPGGPPSGGYSQQSAGDQAREEEKTKSRFAERDRNHDGVLQPEEMSDSLRVEVEKWDKNQNGVIEWEEYKEYSLARSRYFQEQQGNSNGGYGYDNQPMNHDQEQPRLVYRAGFLPKDLPNWFSQTKHNDPTQISLSEWLAANQNTQKGTVSVIEDFRRYDRNLDGFITIEEALAAEKARTGRSTPLGGAINSNGQPPPREEPMLVIAPVPENAEGAPRGMMTSYGTTGGNRGNMFGKGGPTMPTGGDPRSMFGKGGFTMPTGGDPRSMFGKGGFTMPTGGDPRRGSNDKSSNNDPKKSESGRPSGSDSKGRGR